jgi:hypothetical protein
MGSLHPFIPRDDIFDAEATANLCEAFDKACRELHDGGQPEIVREVIAKRMIEIAGRGEHDPGKLCDATLVSLGLKHRG